MKYEILLADDDDSVRLVLHKALTRAGHTVKATDNAETLVKWAESGQGDIVVTDVMMGGREVFESLPQLTEARPKLPVIIISANNTVNTALKSGQHKVFEYVPKPFDLDDVTNAVSRAGQSVNPRKTRANVENKRLPMIGRSAVMQPVFRAVSRFAAGNLPVLIRGSVGSGKDLVARLLHDGGPRVERPFLRTTDFENTSLTLQKVNGGDIYIDEIGELSMHQQERLLALMNEAEMIPPNRRPRIISATRKDLRDLVEDGAFRDDLLFRINVAEIKIPNLAERDRVRELENLVRRLAVLYSDDVITANMVLQEFSKDLPPIEKAGAIQNRLDDQLEEACRTLLESDPSGQESVYITALAWVERPLIIEALRITGGNRAKAADKLGIHRNTLRTRLKSLNID